MVSQRKINVCPKIALLFVLCSQLLGTVAFKTTCTASRGKVDEQNAKRGGDEWS